ncbi:hypothetical protein I6M54_16290 [Shewanella algae]|uniref:Uncharacterized protein n=1 Tax=Shewanella algae TaxID=38313 RepID=A0AAD1KBV8_9GAMM|nr:hypothetical protein [Shewanella algae]MBO2596373.1 hypothetical protein [Shewanella algae]MBO2667730.1 hypothetical protein [Shewanella algae]BCV46225.1 hypothetical protein TUM17379_32430 [Shewanella algae]
MDNQTLAKLFMEHISSKSVDELIEELHQATPTGVGDIVDEDYVFGLLDREDGLDMTIAKAGRHRFVATDYFAEIVLKAPSFGTVSFGERCFGGYVDHEEKKMRPPVNSDENYCLAA